MRAIVANRVVTTPLAGRLLSIADLHAAIHGLHFIHANPSGPFPTSTVPVIFH
jgi:hypothetical protein